MFFWLKKAALTMFFKLEALVYLDFKHLRDDCVNDIHEGRKIDYCHREAINMEITSTGVL